MKRGLDILCALMGMAVFAVPGAIIAICIRLTSPGPAIYWSSRVGKDNQLFDMPKFRTMRVGAPAVATHLLADARSHLSPIGGFLRKTSLDEIPQLWSVLVGHMSLVGPRPALFNQADLIELRTAAGVHRLVPGVTGWAQINGRDELPIALKVRYDEQYLQRMSFGFDLYILLQTVKKVVMRSGVSH
ncbi:sugar transferase [Herbaspirillum sp. YR522]|uniref:sugar transferase n=1 Tax=Herbaspirillum sp. YR522 TaxID=1144342 RepID=UPI00026F9141|nr:sugar transferase [Herbaspirillum sp. YR522]EJN00856.1 glycosyl transferase possibly involved in lipopolysaccharide synthesis [Herbaspirillum sp. YR522]